MKVSLQHEQGLSIEFFHVKINFKYSTSLLIGYIPLVCNFLAMNRFKM